MQENGLNKSRTIVSEVSSFDGYPVFHNATYLRYHIHASSFKILTVHELPFVRSVLTPVCPKPAAPRSPSGATL